MGTNRYAYALNDPVNLSDPNGNFIPFLIAAVAVYKVASAGAAIVDVYDTTRAVVTGQMSVGQAAKEIAVDVAVSATIGKGVEKVLGAGVDVAKKMVGNGPKVDKADIISGKGYDAGDNPVRLEGEWSESDIRRGLFGHPPRDLGNPDIHHGGQMPGGAKHEILPEDHRNNGALHPNKFNQGVTNEMRQQDRQLHWWYRAREQGADQLFPNDIYD